MAPLDVTTISTALSAGCQLSGKNKHSTTAWWRLRQLNGHAGRCRLSLCNTTQYVKASHDTRLHRGNNCIIGVDIPSWAGRRWRHVIWTTNRTLGTCIDRVMQIRKQLACNDDDATWRTTTEKNDCVSSENMIDKQRTTRAERSCSSFINCWFHEPNSVVGITHE